MFCLSNSFTYSYVFFLFHYILFQVVYDKVTELKGRILKLVVKSKGTFVGAVNIQLSSVQLNEEKWYPLGNSVI